MEARAYAKYIRIAPRKVQIVLDLISNKPVKLALGILENTPKMSCEPITKLLKSAIANATVKGMDVSRLYVSECFVCPGPTLKRYQPVAHGRAHSILKRTSHITMALKEAE